MQIVYDVNIIPENFNVEPIECYIWTILKVYE
jgi:hypothetical protein